MASTRYDAIIQESLASHPDILCYQEVTETFLNRWMKHDDAYTWEYAPCVGETYGLLTATRDDTVTFDVLDLPSYQGRVALVAKTHGHSIVNVHLESRRASFETREEQLQNLLTQPDHDLIAGDFNFGQDWQEDNLCTSPWKDAWRTLRGWDPGFTVDDEDNPMRAWMRPEGTRRERYDRVWYRGDRVRPTSIQRCLDAPLPGHTPPLTPSDHFGLEVVFTR